MKNKLNIIGLGNMGSALIAASKEGDFEIIGFDVSDAAMPVSKDHFHRAKSIQEIYDNGFDTILAVKPPQIESIAKNFNDKRTILSIAAGVSSNSIKKATKNNNPVIRIMPNTPMQIKKGMSVLYATEDVAESTRKMYLDFFKNTGNAFFINNEEMMHAVTAISGSGPAYVYLFAASMENAGVALGLSRKEARDLAVATISGAAELLAHKNIEPEKAIHEVTSPGGTTIDAILKMKKEGFENAVHEGVRAAFEKSRKLSG